MRKPRRRISQRAARAALKRVKELENFRSGTFLDYCDVREGEFAAAKTAITLGYRVEARCCHDPKNRLHLYAVKP